MTTPSAETSAATSGLPEPGLPEPGPASPGPSEPGRTGLAARLLHPDPTVRRLAAITLVNTVGSGLSLSVGVLFFTRVLGLTAAQLGLGLTAAGLCGVAASVPAGRAADRWGARPVLVVLVTVNALGTAGYALVHSYAAFLPLACVVSAVDRGSAAVRNALYAQVLPADRRVAGRAYLRVVTNIGICLGTALGAIALQADTRGPIWPRSWPTPSPTWRSRCCSSDCRCRGCGAGAQPEPGTGAPVGAGPGPRTRRDVRRGSGGATRRCGTRRSWS
ncbi:MFS transporter [Kitasatospora aburaviensis]